MWGQVYKLCDFGVAKRFAKNPLVSSEKVVVGTLSANPAIRWRHALARCEVPAPLRRWTIAPEVLRLENYSETCDVWSKKTKGRGSVPQKRMFRVYSRSLQHSTYTCGPDETLST